jgi:hypothetical protein
VAFIYDKSEYKEELSNLKNVARFLSTRDNLRIGIVDDVRLIKKFKNQMGTKWF